MWLLDGEISPLNETERLKGTTRTVENYLGVSFKQEAEGSPDSADVHRLPEAVEHQNMLIQVRLHTEIMGRNLAGPTEVSINPMAEASVRQLGSLLRSLALFPCYHRRVDMLAYRQNSATGVVPLRIARRN